MADEVRKETPKIDGGGLRYNEGKVQIDLIPPSLIFAVGEVMTKGAQKYAPHNWRRGMAYSKVVASLFRHLMYWMSPFHSDFDKESGLNHMWHVATNAAFLIEYDILCPHLDDRFKLETKDE